MGSTNLKAPASQVKNPATPATATTTAPATPAINASAYGFSDMDEADQASSYAATDAKSAEQSKTQGTSQSAYVEGTPLFKSSEGVHFLRPISFPGESNKLEHPDDASRKLPRWMFRYKLYRITDRVNKQDSGPIVCRPGEDLLQKARIALFQDSRTAPGFKAMGDAKQFDISCSERIVFLCFPFNGKGLDAAQLVDLPVSRPKNPKKPLDAPKRQVGDDLRDLPTIRQDDPVIIAALPEGVPPPLLHGPVYNLEKGRLVALTVSGKKETMQRTVEAKSVYPLSAGGQILPQFAEVLRGAFELFGKAPIESLLKYSSQEDQINWIQSLAPGVFGEVALRAMGVKNVPVSAPVAPVEQEVGPDAPAF